MPSYLELLKELEKLEKQIAAAKDSEVGAAIDRVREIVREYGLTPEQVFPEPRGKRGRKMHDKGPKYRDPLSGATWSGMGREPHWIKGQPRERFLIQP